MSLGTVEVVVPDADNSHEHGKVVLERSLLEMLVHTVGTLKELLKVVIANIDGYGQADGAPQTVAPTNPVPEREHVCLVNAKCSDSLCVRAERDEVLGNVDLVLGCSQEPVTSGFGI